MLKSWSVYTAPTSTSLLLLDRYPEFQGFFFHSLEITHSGLSAFRWYINMCYSVGIYYELAILFLGVYMEKHENIVGEFSGGLGFPPVKINFNSHWNRTLVYLNFSSMDLNYKYDSPIYKNLGKGCSFWKVSAVVQVLDVTLKESIKICSNLAGLVAKVDVQFSIFEHFVDQIRTLSIYNFWQLQQWPFLSSSVMYRGESNKHSRCT